MKLIELLTIEEKKICKTLNYKKGTVIHFEDEICDSLGIVLDGEIEISSILLDGRKVIYNIIKSNEIFGGNLIFSSNPSYKGDVISITDSKIAFINKKDLIFLMQNNSKFMEEYLKMQSDFAKALNYKIKLLSIESAKERIMYYFQYNGGKNRINSITRLSEELCLSREATSRTITKLIAEGKILRKNKYIFLKEKAN